jgi:hypothetical protein
MSLAASALTRRKDPHRPDRWIIYAGDIAVGSIGKCAGVPLHNDQWEWGCGLPSVSGRRLSAAGSAWSFEQAREAFGAAWAKIEPQMTPADLDAERRQRAWTAWKYAMHEANLPLPTQLASGRSNCFCGAGIDIGSMLTHVATDHLEMQ